MNEQYFEINNETKISLKPFPFLELKNKILGAKYSLTLNILKPAAAKKLNIKTRGQTYTPNTLSLIYTKNSGEIILTPRVIKKDCKKFGHTEKQHTIFLYIHSLLHLKGLEHGDKMDKLTQKYFSNL